MWRMCSGLPTILNPFLPDALPRPLVTLRSCRILSVHPLGKPTQFLPLVLAFRTATREGEGSSGPLWFSTLQPNISEKRQHRLFEPSSQNVEGKTQSESGPQVDKIFYGPA